ncbi:MAG: ParB/RepB/Spo0J family partition protein [Nitrososphaeraceae archaeon]
MSEKKKLSPLQNLQQGILANLQERSPVTAINNTDTHNANNKDLGITINQQSYSISVEQIIPNPYQPRREFDQNKIIELAESIESVGQIEPIVVRRSGDQYELIVGERRLRAFQYLKRPMIDAVIRDADDGLMAVMALAENIDREDLSDYEIGLAIKNIEHLFTSKKDIANYIGKTRMDVYRYTSFLELPSWVLARLNVNPRIINRTNAQALRSLINGSNYEEAIYREHIEKAMDFLELGSLTQTLFISRIDKMVRDANNPRNKQGSITKKEYKVGGKNIGKLVHDDNNLLIKIKSAALSEEDINDIHSLILNKISDK